MQATKNGLKSILRTPGKTLLFLAVLTALAALLSVSFCVVASVTGYLRDADEYFHTVAELEYMGEEHPDRTVFDPAAFAAAEAHRAELDALLSDEAVLSFAAEDSAIALVDGIEHATQADTGSYRTVLAVTVMSYEQNNDLYTVQVTRQYYASNKLRDRLLAISGALSRAIGVELEIGHRYLMAGYSSRDGFVPEAIPFEDAAGQAEAPACTPLETYDLPEDSVYLRLARLLRLENNSCRVNYTANLPELLPFHQQQMQLTDGRFFTEAEYAERAKVCIVSERVAGMLGLRLGDSISMSVLCSDTDPSRVSTLYEREAGAYEIVGIFNEVEDYPNQIYLPAPQTQAFRPTYGFTLGQFRLDNARTADFLRRADALKQFGFRVSVYDQGYAAATEPLRQLLFYALLFLSASLLLAVAALGLMGCVFVSRQRDTAQTMYALGTEKRQIRVYFLSAVLLLALLSAAAGCVIGRAVEARVLALLQELAAQMELPDTRYSFTQLALLRSLAFDPKPSAAVYLAAAGLLLLGAALSALLFAGRLFASPAPKRRKKAAPRRSGGVSRLSGRLKYALLSLRRGRARTGAVLLLSLAAALFFCRLTSSLDGYAAQLKRYRQEAEISGYCTDYFGRRLDRLNLKPGFISALMESELVESGAVEDLNLTTDLGHCSILGVWETADGTMQSLEYKEPRTLNEEENLAVHTMRDRLWVGSSSLEGSPQFHYQKPGAITWLEGYDESCFLQPLAVCALSENTMRESGINLGDKILVLYCTKARNSYYLNRSILKVVASYASIGASRAVYSPLNFGRPGSFTYDMETGEMVPGGEGFTIDYPVQGKDEILRYKLSCLSEEDREWVRFSSFTFRLRDALRLDELRDTLEEAGYTYVHSGVRLRDYAILEDEQYLNTVRSMERQIQYVGGLYDFLYVVAGALGAALAWLLAVSRRREIALLRVLGTPPLRILANFVTEQLLLCAFGLALGLGLWRLSGAVPLPACTLCALYGGLWIASTLLCLTAGLRKRAQAALTEPE